MRRILAAILGIALSTQATPVPEVSLPAPNGVLRIAITGDTGEGSERVAKGIAAVHATQPLDAIVLAGDNFYPCGVVSASDKRWSLVAPLATIGVPVFPVLGNHDYCGGADPDAQVRATGTVTNWQFPARQYAVRSLVADFAFIETTPYARGRGRDPERAIRAVLAGSTKRWRIVVGHHPILSSGYHGYRPKDEVRRMRALVPVMKSVGAQLYICGHEHHLELARGKVIYLVSGAGSDPIPPIKLRLATLYPPEIRRERIGFAVVELSQTTMRIRFYDGEGRPKSAWFEF